MSNQGIIARFFGKTAAKAAAPQTPEALTDWLVTRLSDRLGMKAGDFDTQRPLAEYGLDSRTAVSLSGELEELLGRELPPTLLWEHPTVDGLVTALTNQGEL